MNDNEETRRFYKLDIELMNYPDLSLTSKVLFSIIDSYRSNKQKVYASNNYLSGILNSSRSTVIRSLNELIEKGFVKKVYENGNRLLITVNGWKEKVDSTNKLNSQIETWECQIDNSKVSNKYKSVPKRHPNNKKNNKIINKNIDTNHYTLAKNQIDNGEIEIEYDENENIIKNPGAITDNYTEAHQTNEECISNDEPLETFSDILKHKKTKQENLTFGDYLYKYFKLPSELRDKPELIEAWCKSKNIPYTIQIDIWKKMYNINERTI